MAALCTLPLGEEKTFKNALRSIFAKSKWQHQQFDDLMDEFWDQLEKAVDSKIKGVPEKKER